MSCLEGNEHTGLTGLTGEEKAQFSDLGEVLFPFCASVPSSVKW